MTLQTPEVSYYADSPDNPQAAGFGASINGKWYRLAVSPEYMHRVFTKDSLAPRQADQSNVDEQVLDLGNAFSRSDLSGGEGLDWYPRPRPSERRESDDIRYWDSYGMDTSRVKAGAPYALQLLHAWVDWGWTPASEPADMVSAGDLVMVAVDDDVHEIADWTVGTPATSGTPEAAQDVTQLAAFGNEAYALTANGKIWHRTAAATWTQVGTDTDWVSIWGVKNRLLGEAGTGPYELIEVDNAGTETVVDTYAELANSIVDADIAIVAATNDGYLRSYVPQSDTAGAAPTLTVRAIAPMPSDEIPLTLGYNLGVLVIITGSLVTSTTWTQRLYKAKVLDELRDFIVGDMQTLREWTPLVTDTGEVSYRPTRVAASRDELFFTVYEKNEYTASTMWKLDLVTNGVARQNIVATNVALFPVFFQDQLAVVGDDIVRVESLTDFEPEAWLITPNVNFGLNTTINWIAATIDAINLANSGAQIELFRSANPSAILDVDHPSWVLAQRVSNPKQAGIEVDIFSASSKSTALCIKVFSHTGNQQSPQITNFAIRGLPQHRDFILQLPVNVSDMIEVPGRRPYRIPGYGDQVYHSLLSLSGLHVTVEVLRPPFLFQGIVDVVHDPVPYTGHRGSAGVQCVLELRGKRRTAEVGIPFGDAGLGLGHLGIALLGVGQTEAT